MERSKIRSLVYNVEIFRWGISVWGLIKMFEGLVRNEDGREWV